ncbi:sugar phosphate isomerase/epimerase family protein [Portibacter lacus]|uniref:Xylose isomerase n=1 Tax=Portibacter lacus TaxID=1099794 RepID=A0AA37ST91_9BACT|nr:sugar phosphate isomerase/epimerase family protein [Portibacter lacus]GLR19822.1 xylose isomerase [Portibacter lacus]
MTETFDKNIVCCFLYPISKYGYPPPAKDMVKHIREMSEMGFRSIELEGIRKDHLLEVVSRKDEIKSVLEELELEVPYFCTVLPGLSSPDASVKQENIELFRKGCEMAQALGSKGVLDNGPLPPWIFPDDIPVARHYDAEVLGKARISEHIDWDVYWKGLVATMQELCDIAADHGLTYQIHPADGVLASNTDGFLYLAEHVNRSNLRFNFDTANLFVRKENLQLALLRLSKYIDYIHISDNRGHRTEHLPIGKGSIEWDTFFKTLKQANFDGLIGIDVGGSESEVGNLEEAYIDTYHKIKHYQDEIG